MDCTGVNIDSAVEQVHKSGEALGEIVGESVNSADQVRDIATAAEEQSVTSVEISRTLGEINNSAEDSAESMRQSVGTVNEVASQIHELENLVVQLRKQE